MERLKLALELLHKALTTLKKALNYSKKVSIGNDIEAIEAAEDQSHKDLNIRMRVFGNFLKNI